MVPFTRAPRSHANADARERVKGARRRPLHHPGSRPTKPALRAALASAVSLPVGRDTPSRGSRPLAVPDRQPGLNACGAAVLMPGGSTLRLVRSWWVRRLTHPTGFRTGVGWVNAVHPPFTAQPFSVVVGWVNAVHPPFTADSPITFHPFSAKSAFSPRRDTGTMLCTTFQKTVGSYVQIFL